MRKRSVAEVNRLIEDTQHATRNTTYPQGAHQLYEYLNLAAAFGATATPIAPHLHVAPSELEPVATRFGLKPDPAVPILCLNPVVEYGPSERSPPAQYLP